MTSIATGEAVRSFVQGCICRERERVARIFETESDPKKIAQAIRDSSKDDQVFEWAGSGKALT